MTLPHFLGIGAMKAGTSTLHTLLAEHPEIAMAAHRKEVMFFDLHWDRGIAWYEEHFAHAAGRVPGEVTPGYLFHPEAAARIHAVVPQARLIAVLRDPVERAYSQYKFFVKENHYADPVEHFLREHPNAVARGLYHAQLERYRALFPDEQLLVLLFEEFNADPVGQVQRVYRHIGVQADFVPPSAGHRLNASALPRWHRAYALGRRAAGWMYNHDLAWVVSGLKQIGARRLFLSPVGASERFPPLPEATRARLIAHYTDDARRLGDWLGTDLSRHWTWLKG
jgi:hypothetical protein